MRDVWGDARRDRTRGCVYFVLAREVNRVKIGFSSGHPESRFQTFITGSPVELERVGYHPGTQADERRLHARFGKHRRKGEWFDYADEIREYIAKRCRPWHDAAGVAAPLDLTSRACQDIGEGPICIVTVDPVDAIAYAQGGCQAVCCFALSLSTPKLAEKFRKRAEAGRACSLLFDGDKDRLRRMAQRLGGRGVYRTGDGIYRLDLTPAMFAVLLNPDVPVGAEPVGAEVA